jgi:hypothetical protein
MKHSFIFIYCLLLGLNGFSQNQTISEYINQLYQTWDSTYNQYDISHISGDSNTGIQLIKNIPVRVEDSAQSVNVYNLEQQVKLQEANVLKGDIGLDASASYAYNLDPGFGFEDNLFYDQKLRVALGMDLLKSGYFSNHNQAKIKFNEVEMMRLRAPEDQKQLDRYLKWHNIIYQFNLKKIEVLKTREQLATNRVDMATKLNLLKHVTQKELITTISSHAEIQSMLNIYEGYNDQLSAELHVTDQSATDFPLLDIDYTYSYKLLTLEEPDSITMLMLENIELDDKAIHDFKLKPYVAYNFFDLVSTNPDYRNYFSVGVSVSAPLNFNTKNKNNLKEAKTNLAVTPSSDHSEIQQDVLTQFYEFRYKLKQFSTLYHKRKMYEELVRRERVKHSIAPLTFNPIEALELLDNLMQIDIELLDTKQQMYLKVLNIYTDLPYTKANKLIKPITMNDDDLNKNKHSSGIYIWSSSVKKYDPAIIGHYLDLNRINKVTISLNNNAEARTKTFELIALLAKNNVEIEIMIGKNSLINGGFTTYMETLGKNVNWKHISAIHLDVEPHVSKDWHENKAFYLKKYHDLVNEVRTYCDSKSIQLGVSIPTHYPVEDIKQIFETVDRVYFMCYENVKTDFIVRKTNSYPTNKTYIALRTNDFKNRLEMEEKFEDIQSKMNVAGFVIHDFGSLIDFDKDSINK